MTRKMRLLLAAVALVAVIAVAWMFLLSPLRADIASTDASITEQQEKLQQANQKLAAAQTTRAEGKKNQARLMELAKMVPTNSEVPSLLVQIQDMAEQSGIICTSVAPAEPTESEGFTVIPLQLQFTGSYFDLSDFAYRVEQLVAQPGRLLTVKSVSLKPAGDASSTGGSTPTTTGKSPQLTATVTLYAFSMDQSNPNGTATAASSAAPAAGATTATTSSTASSNTTKSN